MSAKERNRRPVAARLMAASLALVCCIAAPRLEADTILLAQTTLVIGSQSTIDAFTVPTAGTVTVQLTDLPWPQVMSSLSFMANSSSQVLSAWSTLGSTVRSFQVGPGTYFTHIAATAGGSLDLGLYSLTLTFQPTVGAVPLPPSGLLLAVGMVLLLFLTLVRGRLGGTESPASVEAAPFVAR